jgi:hypothetical protein
MHSAQFELSAIGSYSYLSDNTKDNLINRMLDLPSFYLMVLTVLHLMCDTRINLLKICKVTTETAQIARIIISVLQGCLY